MTARTLVFAVCAIASIRAFPIPAAAADVPDVGELIVLPPMVVVAERDRVPPWEYLELPGLEVLTRAAFARTRAYLEGLDGATQLLEMLAPVDLQAERSTPARLVLTDSAASLPDARQLFANRPRAETSVAPDVRAALELARETLAAQKNRRVSPPIVITVESGLPDRVANVPMSAIRRARPPIAPEESLSEIKVDDLDATATYVMIGVRAPGPSRIKLPTSAVFDRLTARRPALPPWFINGVAGLYHSSTRERAELVLPPFVWLPQTVTQRISRNPDSPRPVRPLVEFFNLPPPPFASPERMTWEAQAALVVRWALHPDHDQAANLWNFVRRIAGGETVTDELVRTHFGYTSADLRDRISDHLSDAARTGFSLKPRRLTDPEVPRPRLATPAEISRIAGDLERMEIDYVSAHLPQFALDYTQQAYTTLAKGYAAGLREGQFLASWGLLQNDIGNVASARIFLEEAAATGVGRPRVYVELARLQMKELQSKLATRGGPPTNAEIDAIFGLLRKADSLSPPLRDAYTLAAELLLRADRAPTSSEIEFVKSGFHAFPFDPTVIYELALLQVRAGHRDIALDLANRGIAYSDGDEARARFAALRDNLR